MPQLPIINFSKTGDPLVVNFVVTEGDVYCHYWIKLALKDSNQAALKVNGDNTNPQDDTYPLPLPVAINDGRVLRLATQIKGYNFPKSKKFAASLEVFQGVKKIGSLDVENPIPDNKTIVPNLAYALLIGV